MSVFTAVALLALMGACAIAQPPPPTEPAYGYHPPEEMVQESLAEFDAYPKRAALEGTLSEPARLVWYTTVSRTELEAPY